VWPASRVPWNGVAPYVADPAASHMHGTPYVLPVSSAAKSQRVLRLLATVGGMHRSAKKGRATGYH
jgi:hypothetical protein